MRTEVLKKCIKAQFPESKWTKLTSMCWLENHNGLRLFTEIYKAIVNALEELQLVRDIETSSKALQLGKTIITGDFVIIWSQHPYFFLKHYLCVKIYNPQIVI